MGEGFQGFSADALEALLVPGVAERWSAVQERLHPVLVALAELLDQAGRRRLPREWPLYEISWKAARYRNRGRGVREPIDEYHFALDRPPRGAGIYVGVSGDERAFLVGFTSTGARKAELQRLWETSRTLWQPLLVDLPEVRFTRSDGDGEPWIAHYLRARQARYLWAGYRYSWDDPRITTPEFATTLVEDVLRLLPFNEAIMEEAETLDWEAEHGLRERRARYSVAANLPAAEVIVERIAQRGFTFPEAIVRSYHVALQTKPLVILPGISGTGKTRLTRLYADAVYDLKTSAVENPHYLLVAVQPDWHNAKDLLGYFNALTNTFHPTAFLRFLHRASADPQQPYYVCLDEMNLARPEYYLAPILSAIETAEHTVDLGVPARTVATVDGETLRNPFAIPLNVHLTGTLNIDESSFALSDKLLDRANVIELTDVDLAGFKRSYRGPIEPEAWQVIEQLEAIMQGAGQPFGYRTIAEMLRYIETARGVLPVREALDLQIKQKVLPKLRGEDQPRLRRALGQLLQLLGGKAQGGTADGTPLFPEAAAKVRRMQERLDQEGFTDFYG